MQLEWPLAGPLAATTQQHVSHQLVFGQATTREWWLANIAEEVDKRVRTDAADSAVSWKHFCTQSVADGGKVAHRYARGPEAAPTAILDTSGDVDMPVSGKRALQVVMEDWLPCWMSHANDESPENWDTVPALKPITYQNFRAALRTYG